MQAFWCKLPPFGVTLMMKNKALQSGGDRVCLCTLGWAVEELEGDVQV